MTTLAEMEAKVADWISKPENQRLLEETEKAARAAAQRVLDDARVTPEQLRIPCTI